LEWEAWTPEIAAGGVLDVIAGVIGVERDGAEISAYT
jgi:hypothetical protein